MHKLDTLRKVALKYSKNFLEPILKDSRYFVVASGSVGYGFADEDSDIEIEIYTNNSNLHSKINDVINLKPVYEGIEISAGITEWPVEKILNRSFSLATSINPIPFYEIANAYILSDPFKIYSKTKKALGYYSSEDQKKLIRGLYLQIFELGVHIAPKLLKRKQYLESKVAFYEALEALLRLVHMFNEKYFPHAKWLLKNIVNLKNNYGIDNLCIQIEKENNYKDQVTIFLKFIDSFKQTSKLKDFLSPEEIDEPWIMIKDPESYHFINTKY